ncbi:MBL fold metallo-hydrolase [Chloroflexota bacterium]
MQITANIYVETGYRGTNVGYITTERGVVMIDSPWRPTDAVTWRRQIEEKGHISYLINTHSHHDHVFGNFFFTAPIIAHQKAREAILVADKNELLARLAEIDPEGLPMVSEYHINAPSITFSEHLTMYLGGPTIQLIHLPGHTPGEIGIVVPEERVVFVGDNIFCRLQAFLHESDPFTWLQSLKRIGELEVDHIVPGHGEVCDKSYLAEQSGFIQEWVDIVKRAIDQGRTKEEALSEISLLDRYPMAPGNEKMGPELQRMNISRLYDVLTQK